MNMIDSEAGLGRQSKLVDGTDTERTREASET